MPRLLTMQRMTVTSSDRARYFERLKANKAHYAAANCRFWVFEESSLPGAFVEFTESDSEAALISAHAGAPHRPLDPARIYQETEIG